MFYEVINHLSPPAETKVTRSCLTFQTIWTCSLWWFIWTDSWTNLILWTDSDVVVSVRDGVVKSLSEEYPPSSAVSYSLFTWFIYDNQRFNKEKLSWKIDERLKQARLNSSVRTSAGVKTIKSPQFSVKIMFVTCLVFTGNWIIKH